MAFLVLMVKKVWGYFFIDWRILQILKHLFIHTHFHCIFVVDFLYEITYKYSMIPSPHKPVIWIGSSHEDWKDFPDDVQDVMGYALYLAQIGGKDTNVKPLIGFKGASVLEIRDDYLGDTYRAIYTVKFHEVVYVLHAFQKKSKKGIATPKSEIDLIEQRLRKAKEHHDKNYAQWR
jgi:phage-related protein